MALQLFGKKNPATSALVFGAALTALVGKETVTDEEATAANAELEEAGITGAALITPAAFNALEEKAGRVDAAEERATKADEKATQEAEKAASLQADLDTANARITELEKLPGATHSRPGKKDGKSDVEEGGDANQKLVDDLHAKMLAGNLAAPPCPILFFISTPNQ
jgi:hypothetical protein